MDYDGAMGGQVLQSSPPIPHPAQDLTKLYMELIEAAKSEGLELREIETRFERKTPKGPWTHRTRFIRTGEYKAFTKKVAPLNEEIGALLRKVGSETASDWYKVSFNPGPENRRVLVLHGDRVRVVKEPTPELMQLAGRLAHAAESDGLGLVGASWSISAEDADDVDATIRVNRAWPAVE
jgi:hypothetical protein